MFVSVHPAETMLRGDSSGYNPRDVVITAMAGACELVTGVFRDDGVRSEPRRADRPFHIILPKSFDAWHSLNTRVFYALQSDAPVIEIDLCFANED